MLSAKQLDRFGLDSLRTTFVKCFQHKWVAAVFYANRVRNFFLFFLKIHRYRLPKAGQVADRIGWHFVWTLKKNFFTK